MFECNHKHICNDDDCRHYYPHKKISDDINFCGEDICMDIMVECLNIRKQKLEKLNEGRR